MLELDKTQHLIILQQLILKMTIELTKEDWVRARQDNIGLIINNKMQIQMAETVILMCDEKIAEFPEEEKKE